MIQLVVVQGGHRQVIITAYNLIVFIRVRCSDALSLIYYPFCLLFPLCPVYCAASNCTSTTFVRIKNTCFVAHSRRRRRRDSLYHRSPAPAKKIPYYRSLRPTLTAQLPTLSVDAADAARTTPLVIAHRRQHARVLLRGAEAAEKADEQQRRPPPSLSPTTAPPPLSLTVASMHAFSCAAPKQPIKQTTSSSGAPLIIAHHRTAPIIAHRRQHARVLLRGAEAAEKADDEQQRPDDDEGDGGDADQVVPHVFGRLLEEPKRVTRHQRPDADADEHAARELQTSRPNYRSAPRRRRRRCPRTANIAPQLSLSDRTPTPASTLPANCKHRAPIIARRPDADADEHAARELQTSRPNYRSATGRRRRPARCPRTANIAPQLSLGDHTPMPTSTLPANCKHRAPIIARRPDADSDQHAASELQTPRPNYRSATRRRLRRARCQRTATPRPNYRSATRCRRRRARCPRTANIAPQLSLGAQTPTPSSTLPANCKHRAPIIAQRPDADSDQHAAGKLQTSRPNYRSATGRRRRRSRCQRTANCAPQLSLICSKVYYENVLFCIMERSILKIFCSNQIWIHYCFRYDLGNLVRFRRQAKLS